MCSIVIETANKLQSFPEEEDKNHKRICRSHSRSGSLDWRNPLDTVFPFAEFLFSSFDSIFHVSETFNKRKQSLLFCTTHTVLQYKYTSTMGNCSFNVYRLVGEDARLPDNWKSSDMRRKKYIRRRNRPLHDNRDGTTADAFPGQTDFRD